MPHGSGPFSTRKGRKVRTVRPGRTGGTGHTDYGDRPGQAAGAGRAFQGAPGNLLAPPGPDLLTSLDQALAALARAFPIPAGRQKGFSDAVHDLSRTLTSERGELARPYWASPAMTAAYLRFFLPWNLYRLAWLLPGLDLPLRAGDRILDLGSGPLTLPLALWCARPDLRALPLHFTCADVAPKPLEHGRAVFRALAGEDSPWHFHLLRAPLEKALRGAGQDRFPGRTDRSPDGNGQNTGPGTEAKVRSGREGFALIMAGNVLNELEAATSRKGRDALDERLERIAELAWKALRPDGRLFLLEPGTRLGGTLIAMFRQNALDLGFAPLAPCTHAGACPALEERRDRTGRHESQDRPGRPSLPDRPGRSSLPDRPGGHTAQARSDPYERHDPQHRHDWGGASYSGWCHFTHPATGAPGALLEIGAKARLSRDSLALSCLLLRRPEQAGPGTALAEGGIADLDGLVGIADLDGLAGIDGLDELEALHAEIMAEDAAGTPPPGPAGPEPRDPRPSACGPDGMVDSRHPLPLRVISAPIRLPEHTEPARYACGACGLALLLDALKTPSGAGVRARSMDGQARDPKTGALIMERGHERGSGGQAAERTNGPGSGPGKERHPARGGKMNTLPGEGPESGGAGRTTAERSAGTTGSGGQAPSGAENRSRTRRNPALQATRPTASRPSERARSGPDRGPARGPSQRGEGTASGPRPARSRKKR